VDKRQAFDLRVIVADVIKIKISKSKAKTKKPK
jgi:hypothetical protein